MFGLAVLLGVSQAACGDSGAPLGGGDVPAAIRVGGARTANVFATATATNVEGEIVIPTSLITGRLQINLLEREDGGFFQPRAGMHPTVTSSDGEVAFWDPNDNAVWLGKVVGARRGTATLQITIFNQDDVVVFRAAPIPVRFAEP